MRAGDVIFVLPCLFKFGSLDHSLDEIEMHLYNDTSSDSLIIKQTDRHFAIENMRFGIGENFLDQNTLISGNTSTTIHHQVGKYESHRTHSYAKLYIAIAIIVFSLVALIVRLALWYELKHRLALPT
ncbi:hypothetical protein PRIPAC_80852 [Pristionchus pacificus]|uniref:Uncharacterized protein n=1 Tax=Pristionchus pacificus TaxID=54126 RepID=A0A2A6CPR2_PRIPA|nr:hypothetical protein PRIPAC_80852 [Pristionchus pacificus]|eukprot:PDM80184.1 hypothetical protein PRIPAC_32763 [Pristionchus pacificus]